MSSVHCSPSYLVASLFVFLFFFFLTSAPLFLLFGNLDFQPMRFGFGFARKGFLSKEGWLGVDLGRFGIRVGLGFNENEGKGVVRFCLQVEDGRW